jgi:hypothetical protein
MELIIFMLVGAAICFVLAKHYEPQPPPPAPPPPELRQYPVSVTIGDIIIENLIIGEVPRPFVEASVQAEVQALTESYTRQWYDIYSKDHEADDAAYRSLEYTLRAIASPNFKVRRAVVKNLPPFAYTEEPSPAEIIAADITDREETLKTGRELYDRLPDDPDFGSTLKDAVMNLIKNGIHRESFLARRRRKSRLAKSYRLATAVPPKYGGDGLR